jgi:transcription factor SPN1
MSQTQPELIDAITDLFGDSDSDEDDDLPITKSSSTSLETSNTVETSGLKDNLYDSDTEEKIEQPKKKQFSHGLKMTKQIDEDDLFQSDDEEEMISQTKNKKRLRLQKNETENMKKKIKSTSQKNEVKGHQKSSSRQTQNRTPGTGGGTGASTATADGELSDEYDSETDIQKTKQDDEFIDEEEDDTDLLQEYENDQQNFHDERPEFPNGRGGANGTLPSQEKNQPKIDDDPLSQALADMKKKKPKELTETQKGELAHELLHKMDKSYHDDRLLYEQQLPAIHKLKLLPSIKKVLLMKQLQMTLLDYDLLSVLKSWIEPIDKTALVGLTIRLTIYELLSLMPCQTEHIRRSGIGKTLVSLLKHKMETAENKQKLREIIEKWSRPIFGKSVDSRALDRRHKERLQTPDEAYYIRQQALKQQTSPRHSSSTSTTSREEDMTSLLSSKIDTIDDSSDRVRLPLSNGFLFSSAVPSKLIGSTPSKPKKEEEKGKRQELTKSLKQLKADSGKKTFRLVQAAVSGRDKA